jgi:hypothetical protein
MYRANCASLLTTQAELRKTPSAPAGPGTQPIRASVLANIDRDRRGFGYARRSAGKKISSITSSLSTETDERHRHVDNAVVARSADGGMAQPRRALHRGFRCASRPEAEEPSRERRLAMGDNLAWSFPRVLKTIALNNGVIVRSGG